MSKLRCYAKNHGEEKIIELVKYSREQRSLKRTGTDDCNIKRVTIGEIMNDHYDQARSYIDRIQATIPGMTARRTASIRTQMHLL